MQAGQQGQGQDGRLYPREADGDGHDDPVMTAGGGDPFLGRGDGIAEPTESPNTLAPFVGQRVIDQEGDETQPGEACQDKAGNVIGQSVRVPGGAFKEVVEVVQAVALGRIGRGLR
jgi:hypothetical protein